MRGGGEFGSLMSVKLAGLGLLPGVRRVKPETSRKPLADIAMGLYELIPGTDVGQVTDCAVTPRVID
jgi:hypothetical protein